MFFACSLVLSDQVQFLSSGQPIPDECELRKLLSVRQDKVIEALEWLCKYNPVYQRHCSISKENAACYAQNDVPRALYRSITTIDSRAARKQRSTYARADEQDGEPDEKSSTASDGEIPLEMRGVVDNRARVINDERMRESAAKNSALDSVLFVPSGNPASDYHNPDLWAGSFPDIFPYGSGVPDDPDRPVKLSLAAFARHSMYAASDTLRTDRVFPFFLFNVLQRHRVHHSAFTSLQMHRFDQFENLLETLQPAKLKEAVRELDAAQRENGYAAMKDIGDNTLRAQCNKVFRELRTIGGRVPLNESTKLAARRELFALTLFYGPPDIYVTVNPEDENSSLLLHLAGEVVNLELDDPDTPANLPSNDMRRRILARDPLAGALYSHSIMAAVNYALLGVGNDGEDLGVFGKVAAYHWNSEEQNRGSLHWHGMVWLANKPDPQIFRDQLETPEFQKRVYQYLDSVVLQQPPALCTRGPFENPQAASANPEDYQYPLKKPRWDDHPSLTRPSDPASFDNDEQWYQHVAADLNRLIPVVQTHARAHTITCRKPALIRPKLVDDDEAQKQCEALGVPPCKCRFHFPRVLQSNTGFDEDGDLQSQETIIGRTRTTQSSVTACGVILICGSSGETTAMLWQRPFT